TRGKCDVAVSELLRCLSDHPLLLCGDLAVYCDNSGRKVIRAFIAQKSQRFYSLFLILADCQCCHICFLYLNSLFYHWSSFIPPPLGTAGSAAQSSLNVSPPSSALVFVYP